ncbi:MAG: FkbM family methyltransferase [Pseudomonadota bacterium]
MRQVLATDPPFGAYALSGVRAALRAVGCSLPEGFGARRVASFLRKLTILGREDPFDVMLFQGQSVRLYPRDNLCEKRVFAAPQLWDSGERAALDRAIAAAPADRPFVFIDAGANVGLYSLFARSAAARHGRAFKGLAIEPDPETARRLRFNLDASGANEITVAETALAAEEGTARLATHGDNRGETAIAAGSGGEDGEGAAVRAAPLAKVMEDARIDKADALKIDIEGVEFEVLNAYFKAIAPGDRPATIIMETPRRGDGNEAALKLCRENGYEIAERTRMNSVLAKRDF